MERRENGRDKRNEDRLEAVMKKLGRSRFRSGFSLDSRDSAYLERKGLATVLSHGREFLRERLAPASPLNDGRQTPWRGHPVFVAQHATATCCRGCLLKWHGMPKKRKLTEQELDYIIRLIEEWLSCRRRL